MPNKNLQKKVSLINTILGERCEHYEKVEMEYCEYYGYVLTKCKGSVHLHGRLSKKEFSSYLDGVLKGLLLVGFE